MTAKTTRNTKNADRFEALHILRSIAALTARNKTGTRAADENAPRVGRDGSKKYGYVRRRLVYSRERKVFNPPLIVALTTHQPFLHGAKPIGQ